VPKRRAAGLTQTVAKVSAGAIEYVPVCRVTNLADTLKQLKKEDFWVFGTDAAGDSDVTQTTFDGPLILVIGSEGKGLGTAVKKQCDSIVSLPMAGHVNSLNASVATAVLLFQASQQRK
jgi:23S rRNA (guanosine2251-2'-O)-methyltransferase